MLSMRYERVNALAKLNNAQRYLEIGVFKGITFQQVNIPFKVGVDPTFAFKTAEFANECTIFHEVTSDAFFAKLAPIYGKFDVIYLDGLHTFEQTFRDFCASIAYAHERTIWLIDDTGPANWFSSLRNRQLAAVLRRFAWVKNPEWMGDVFRLVFALHDFFPQYSYATFPEHNQTVVWTEPRQNFKPDWDSLVDISNLTYGDFKKRKASHFAVMEPGELLARVERGLNRDRVALAR